MNMGSGIRSSSLSDLGVEDQRSFVKTQDDGYVTSEVLLGGLGLRSTRKPQDDIEKTLFSGFSTNSLSRCLRILSMVKYEYASLQS